MEHNDLESWEEFDSRIHQLQGDREGEIEAPIGRVSHLLFRGQSDHSWSLNTTLDRTESGPWAETGQWSVSNYFRLASIARPQIQTFTGLQWQLEDWPALREWSKKYDNLLWKQFPGYDYFVYLRHHGFPSPLLDWTRSPYVAAYFAFDQPVSDRVAVYVYREHSGHGKFDSSDRPQIVSFGPYVSGHSRHFLQQSEYTIAVQFNNGEWWYAFHEDAFASAFEAQDQLWKFTIPATERLKVLNLLDAHNLNAFSLFQTDESLLRTIAVREVELRERQL